MRFDSKDPSKFNSVLAAGIYDGEVVKAEEKTSKKGNDMIALTIKVFHQDQSVLVNDWLVSMDEMIPKIFSFCSSAGIEAEYHSGELTAELCVGLAVKVKLAIEASTEFGDKNVVKGYVTEKVSSKPSAAYRAPQGVPAAQTIAANRALQEASSNGEESDIPF
jgi:hypothetical protein